MKVKIQNKEYKYIEYPMETEKERAAYFELAKKVFSLDFTPWYQSGYTDKSFIPHTLFEDGRAAASAGVFTSNFKWQNAIHTFSQISTVMTHPEYRGRGLNKWLLKKALEECQNSDLIYLYANDSVCEFYPRFGFRKATEYTYQIPITPKQGIYRKLDLKNPTDAALLTEYYQNHSNPFSALTMEGGLSQLMFHCITFLYNNIYYLEEHNAIIIAEHEGDEIFCYDIYTPKTGNFIDMISTLAREETKSIKLGFTPINKSGFTVEPSTEKDTTIFTLNSPVNPFTEDKVTLPFLSRA